MYNISIQHLRIMSMSFLEDKEPVLKRYLSEKAKDLTPDEFKKLTDLHSLYQSYFDVSATEDTETSIRALHAYTMKTLSTLDNKRGVFRFVDDQLLKPINDLLINIIEKNEMESRGTKL